MPSRVVHSEFGNEEVGKSGRLLVKYTRFPKEIKETADEKTSTR